MSKLTIRHIRALLWGTFLIFLFLQYQNVFLYYDDYGYMSMTYGYDLKNSGASNVLYNIVDYMWHSYFYVNGRIFTNFLLIISANLGGIKFMRIVLPVVITFIYFLEVKIICQKISKKNEIIVTLFVLISYGVIPLSVCNYGVYWFAAAYGYIIPILLLVVLIYYYNAEGKRYSIIRYVVTFLLCISSEQAVVMTITWILGNMAYEYIKKHQIEKRNIFLFVDSILGAILLICSPASRSRLTTSDTYGESIIKKIFYYTGRTISQIHVLGNLLQYTLFLLPLIICIIKIYKRNSKRHLISVMYIIFMIIYNTLYNLGIYKFPDLADILVWLIFFSLFFVYVFLHIIKINYQIAIVTVAMFSSIGIMFIMPEAPLRTFIPFLLLLPMMCAPVFLSIETKSAKMITLSILTIGSIFSLINLKSIFCGYKQNSKIMTINESRMLEVSDKIRAGESISQIHLYKAKNNEYCGQQPYFDGISYMLFWYDNYYSLPYSIKYVFREYPIGEEEITIDILD